MAPSGNQTATEKTNINLKRSEKPVYSPKAGERLKEEIKGDRLGQATFPPMREFKKGSNPLLAIFCTR